MASLGITLAFMGLGGVAMVVGGGVIYKSHQSRQSAADVEAIERTDIADLTPGDGLVEVQGKARVGDGGTIDAPIAGTEGVVVETRIGEHVGYRDADDGTIDANDSFDEHDHDGKGIAVGSSKTEERWTQVHADFSAVPFRVDDGTGEAIVEVSGPAYAKLEHERRNRIDADEPTPEGAREYLREVPDVNADVDAARTYQQTAIEPGEQVYVLADVVERDTDGGTGLVLTDDENADDAVVSDTSKETVTDHEAAGSLIGYAMGAVFLLIGLGVFAIGLVV